MTSEGSANNSHARWAPTDLMADYGRLLEQAGSDPSATVSGHLKTPNDPPLSAPVTSDLLADSGLAARCLDQTVPRLNAPDRRTAATVLWQRLSLDLLAPACVLWMIRQQLPLHLPDQIGWCLETGNWAQLGAPESSRQTPDEALESLGYWLDTMQQLFRGHWQVSKSGFWSSAALATARPYSLLFMQVPGHQWRSQAERWLQLMPAPIARYLNWEDIERQGTTLTIPRRKGCCLKFRLPDGKLCGTCGIRR